jgi:hypothetical protein
VGYLNLHLQAVTTIETNVKTIMSGLVVGGEVHEKGCMSSDLLV